MRGVGIASRLSEDFLLPSDWITEERRVGSEFRITYRSPAGRCFTSRTAVQEFLAGPRITAIEADTADSPSMDESGSEYFPTPRKGRRLQAILEESTTSIAQQEQPENCLFFTELRAFTTLLEGISAQRKCSTEGCLGTLVPISVDRTGLGGGARIQLACDECTSSNLVFNTSTYVQDSRRHVASLSIALAFLLTGHVHSGYHKTLGRGIGIPALHRNTFYMVEKEAYPHIQRMLQSMCECAKEEMKAMGAEELGGWKNAVTTADGCWLTRGHFSQNFTFIIKNYQKNTILWYGHLCMRGSDDVVEEPLYPGTAKSAEGHLAGKLFQQAKEEGCQVSVNWQDSDSSSAKAITTVYPLVSIMYCSGHVGRAHAHQLVDLKAKKAFTKTYKDNHRAKHPSVDSVTCCCANSKHRAGCGCITEDFIRSARVNHFLVCIQSGKDAQLYATRIRELGKYHARGIHQWEGGKCSFHPSTVCSCGNCDDEDNLLCEGKPYESRFTLSCELHSLGYEVECEKRASNAGSVIHPIMGRGHSNLCEAAFNVLPRFRSKSLAIHCLSYITLSNWGLIMSCSPDTSPYVSLFERMGLPILDGMEEIWQEDMEARLKYLGKKKKDEVKKYRNEMKSARVAEQQERKQWVKRQQIIHSYGTQEDELDIEQGEMVDSESTIYSRIGGVHSMEGESEGILLVTGPHTQGTGNKMATSQASGKGKDRKPCKCGSRTHSRVSFHGCPLNKHS